MENTSNTTTATATTNPAAARAAAISRSAEFAGSTSNRSATVTTMSTQEFGKLLGLKSLQVVRNPHQQQAVDKDLKPVVDAQGNPVMINKLFVAAIDTDGNALRFKCQQDLDTSKPMVFVINDGNYADASLANAQDNTVADLSDLL